jgi:hypothetical protein
MDPVPTRPAPEPVPDPDTTPPSATFSPTQQLVADRIVACERGAEGADSDETVTRDAQLDAVHECLDPALTLAGAIGVEPATAADALEPPTLVFLVGTQAQLDELDAILPTTVSGVVVTARLATSDELDAAAAAAAGGATA